MLDTNVIISAFAGRGICNDVFECCLKQHEFILSDYIIKEVENHLAGTLKLPGTVTREIKEYLRKEALIVKPVKLSGIKCRDKNDIPIIETAVSGKADVIVTGDKDLLEIKKYKYVLIISPRELWNKLKKNSTGDI